MSTRHRNLLACLLALAASACLWLAACGNSDTDGEDYAEQAQSALSGLSEELSGIGEELGESSDSADLASGLDQLRSDLDETAAELEGLDVPDDLVEANEELVAAISTFATDLDPVIELAESGGGQAAQRASSELIGLVGDFQANVSAALQKAEEAGVTLTPDEAGTTTTAPAE